MEPIQKHACPDCQFCQFCSETRCHACRKRCGGIRKLSMAEEIALYERMNPDAADPSQPIFYRPKNSTEEP